MFFDACRGNVHRKQNCFRGVLLFKTHFAEFCVKYVCKTMPWNWAVILCSHRRAIIYSKADSNELFMNRGPVNI